MAATKVFSKFIEYPEDEIYEENLNQLRKYQQKQSFSQDSIYPLAVIQEQRAIHNKFKMEKSNSSKLFIIQDFDGAYNKLSQLLEIKEPSIYIENQSELRMEKKSTIIFKDSLLLNQKDVEYFFLLDKKRILNHKKLKDTYILLSTSGNQTPKIEKEILYSAYQKIYDNSSAFKSYTPQLLSELKALNSLQQKVIDLYPLKTKALEKTLKKTDDLSVAKQLILDF